MAKLIIDDNEYDLPDGAPIEDSCKEAGVPFSCQSGVCGTCQIEILDGHDKLSPINMEEEDLGMDRNNRLGCQCRIMSGEVRVTF